MPSNAVQAAVRGRLGRASFPPPRLTRAGVAFLVLMALAVLQARLLTIVEPTLPPRALLFGIPYFILVFNTVWAVLYPAVDSVSTRTLSRRWPLAIATHLGSAVLFAVTHLAGVLVVGTALRSIHVAFYWPGKFTAVGLATSFGYYDLLLYALLAAGATLREMGSRLRETEFREATLEAELSKAELAALRMQLQPHFLFNALNTVSGYVAVDPRKAVEMIAQLGSLLRRALQAGTAPQASLAAEIDFVRGYLQIEQQRFSDRLAVRIDSDPGSLSCVVPNMILLPLVENAVRHGVAQVTGPAEIAILTRCTAGRLEILVRDNGPGPGAWVSREDRWGIGLRNTRERLARTFGPLASLEVRPAPVAGTEVRLVMPGSPGAEGVPA